MEENLFRNLIRNLKPIAPNKRRDKKCVLNMINNILIKMNLDEISTIDTDTYDNICLRVNQEDFRETNMMQLCFIKGLIESLSKKTVVCVQEIIDKNTVLTKYYANSELARAAPSESFSRLYFNINVKEFSND